MATLTVPLVSNFGSTVLDDISLVDFTGPSGTLSLAVFASRQFDNEQIRVNVAIDGSPARNTISVVGGSLDASIWTFSNWRLDDRVVLKGSALDDVIFGSSQKDQITGGLGADILNGGGGDDVFIYESAAESVAGERIIGFTGTDTIRLQFDSFGDSPFRAPEIDGVERLELAGQGNFAFFSGSQFGTGAITEIAKASNDSGVVLFIEDSSTLDLSQVAFTNWSQDDFIFATGTANADTLRGSSQSEVISGGGGADAIDGGDGDDFFLYAAQGDIAAGETVDGGGGTEDTIVLNRRDAAVPQVVPFRFSDLSIQNVEKFVFASEAFSPGAVPGGTAAFSGSQIGTGRIATVGGSIAADSILMTGSDTDLTGVSFQQWTSGTDSISLLGTAGRDTLTGSSRDDRFVGGGEADTFVGGAGADRFDGGGGADLADYTAATVSVRAALDASAIGTGDAAGDTFVSIENLKGANIAGGIDRLTGNGDDNSIFGNNGEDIINGRGGLDKLVGGLGADILRGELGDDEFVYFALAEAGDTIADFTSNAAGNNDVFKFRGSLFGGLAAGNLAADQFEANATGATTLATTRFVYDTDDEVLRFDADGSGAGAATAIATLQNGAALAIVDISIF